MILARNIAIIVALALAVTFLPGGGNVTEAILTGLMLMFLAAIALLLGRFWRESEFTRDSLTDRQRWLVYGALGAIAFMVAGLDEMFDSGPGTVAWLAIVGVSVYLIVSVWRQASSY